MPAPENLSDSGNRGADRRVIDSIIDAGAQITDEARKLTASVAWRLTYKNNWRTDTGNQTWDDDAIDELVSEMITLKHDRFIGAALSANNDREFSGWVAKAIRSVSIDRATGTTARQRVSHRIRNMIRDGQVQLAKTEAGFATPGHEDSPVYTGASGPLVEGAFTVATSTVRWDPGSHRTPPFGLAPDLEEVIRVVMEEAGGHLSDPTLIDVISYRFNVTDVGTRTYIETPDDQAVSTNQLSVEDAEVVYSILSQCTSDELDVLREHSNGATFEQIATKYSGSSSTIARRWKRATERLRQLLAPHANNERILTGFSELVTQSEHSDLGQVAHIDRSTTPDKQGEQ